jgi:ankyrin repeat protein
MASLEALNGELIDECGRDDCDLTKVRDLLQRGADVNAKSYSDKDYMRTGSYQVTALISASNGGHEAVVRELLTYNRLDVNAKDDHGETALIVASSRGYEAVERELLMHDRLNVNAKNNYSETALTSASEGGPTGIVRMLLQHDARRGGC